MLQIITTREELQETINNAVSGAVVEAIKRIREEEALLADSDDLIDGISGLRELLKCSAPTAQKLKKLNIFPTYQVGRVIKFKKSEVLEGMRKIDPIKKSNRAK